MPRNKLAYWLCGSLHLLLASQCFARDVALTPLQHQYLASKQQLNYCIDPNWMPFEAIDMGSHVGMSKDYLELVGQLLEIPFKLVPSKSWQHSVELLKLGECELLPMLNISPEREEFALFTDVYFRDPNVLVIRRGSPPIKNYEDLKGKTLAVIAGFYQQELLNQYYPDIITVRVNSQMAGLVRVSSGDMDAMTGSLLAITYDIQKAGLANLVITSDLPSGDELRMATRKDNVLLRDILNAALKAITYQEHSAIYRKWNPIPYLAKTDYTLIWQILLGFSLVLLFVAQRYRNGRQLNRALREKNAELQKLHNKLAISHNQLQILVRHDSMTHLHNRQSATEHIEKELSRWHREPFNLSILIIDVDKFKGINDDYGHAVGDKCLIYFAEILRKNTREMDLAARWGGEEFVVVCSGAAIAEASQLARRFIEQLHRFDAGELPSLRCSIGLAQFHVGDDFESWFERADKALYRAKMRGGDTLLTEFD